MSWQYNIDVKESDIINATTSILRTQMNSIDSYSCAIIAHRDTIN